MYNETLTQTEKELITRERLNNSKDNYNNNYNYSASYDNNGYCKKFN